MTPRIIALALACAMAPIQEARSWGAAGHSIIAEIAQRRLPPRVQRTIHRLLGGTASLASVAGWADQIATQRPETVNWHFVNIPYAASSYDPVRDCRPTPKGDCVVAAIERFKAILADRSQSRRRRSEALIFLVHLVGDIHQPLHCADRDDAGGNKTAVTFFGTATNLHMVWDVGIIEKHAFDWGQHVRELEENGLIPKPSAGQQRGSVADWAWETHVAAVNVAYAIPADGALGDAYYQRSLPIVQRQLALAGIRLARILREALGDRRSHSRRAHATAAEGHESYRDGVWIAATKD